MSTNVGDSGMGSPGPGVGSTPALGRFPTRLRGQIVGATLTGRTALQGTQAILRRGQRFRSANAVDLAAVRGCDD
jgi:hypothetical protein